MNSPFASFAFSISRTFIVFIVEFHAMLAMKIISVSMRYGSPRSGIRDDVVHQAVCRQRVLPGKRMVDAYR